MERKASKSRKAVMDSFNSSQLRPFRKRSAKNVRDGFVGKLANVAFYDDTLKLYWNYWNLEKG